MVKSAVLLCLLLSTVAFAFVCQNTIDVYNAHVNIGDFTGAATLTFDPRSRRLTVHVLLLNLLQYIIPGQQPSCPYCTVYSGRDAVVSLFTRGFLGHFTIWNPLINLRQLTTDNGGPGGVPRLLDFNDEAFRIRPEYNGKYFRVGVIHDFIFDPATCLITQMALFVRVGYFVARYLSLIAFGKVFILLSPSLFSFSYIPPLCTAHPYVAAEASPATQRPRSPLCRASRRTLPSPTLPSPPPRACSTGSLCPVRSRSRAHRRGR